MTVQELIDKLSKLSPEAHVVVYNDRTKLLEEIIETQDENEFVILEYENEWL